MAFLQIHWSASDELE